MKIIITGATGFIGLNYLSAIHNDGNEYMCLVRNQNSCDALKHFHVEVKVIVFNKKELQAAIKGADIIIHMIGQMGRYGLQINEFERVNCLMTEDIVEACLVNNVKQFIYLSTPGVQGFGKRLCKEEEPYAPRGNYEQTKVTAEKYIISRLENEEMKYTIIRPDFVYGPGDYRRIKMYKNIRDKKFILTTSGKTYLHPTYVMDVVQGIQRSVNNEKAYNEIFNISAPNDITVQDYLNTIAHYFGKNVFKINIGYLVWVFFASFIETLSDRLLKKEGFVSKNKIDFLALNHSTSSLKAQRLLGYVPEYDFKSGFTNTMKWCENNHLL